MTTPKKSALRKQLDTIARKYIEKFEQAHGRSFEFAVSDDLIGVLCFGDIYYFSFEDVVFDCDNKLPVNLIFEWRDAELEAYELKSEQKINLQSYASGLRFEHQEVKK